MADTTLHSGTTLHLIRAYRRGGSERRLEDSVRGIPGRHIVLAADWDEPRRRANIPDVDFVLLPHLRRQPGLMDFKAVRETQRALETIRPTVLMTHQAKSHVIGRLAARGNVPTIVSLSMSPSAERLGNAWWTLERYLSRWTGEVAAVGDDVANEYAARVPRQRRPTVIRSSIPVTEFLKVRSTPRPVQRTACFVGSLDERKGAHLLPGIASGLLAAGFRQLIVAGDGPLRARLNSSRGLVTLGHVEDVPDVLAKSHVLLLPSRSEGLPQVLVQAAMAGVPFVTTPVSGARELITMGGTGSIEPRDVDAFTRAAATLAVADAPVADPVLLRQWDPHKVAAEYARLHMRVLTGRNYPL